MALISPPATGGSIDKSKINKKVWSVRTEVAMIKASSDWTDPVLSLACTLG